MEVIKCKMCAGNLKYTQGSRICTCEYCGSEQTLPMVSSQSADLYERANYYRMNYDFEKAVGVYELILEDVKDDPDVYWSLLLCRYGISYVEDKATKSYVPTMNRARYTSVYEDVNYKTAMELSDDSQKAIYRKEAEKLAAIQKRILSVSGKEEPFDVFICYKETDETGRRTDDSIIASEIYRQLSKEKIKTFFARVTLEDKLGSEYEPYIFAALNSAKVMLVLGTVSDYYEAVWVKNEWARFLSLMDGSNGKMLIPLYKDIDPYSLPKELSHLQALDMGKIGFMQDLFRTIKRIIEESNTEKNANVLEPEVATAIQSKYLKEAYADSMIKKFKEADKLYELVLNYDAECAEAYLGKEMVKYGCSSIGEIELSWDELLKPADSYQDILDPEIEYRKNEICELQVPGYYNVNDILDEIHCGTFLRLKSVRYKSVINKLNSLNMTMARKYAVGSLKDRLEESYEKYYVKAKDLCLEAEKVEREKREEILKQYDEKLKESYERIKNRSEEAGRRRAKDYELCVENFKDLDALDINDIVETKKLLEKIGNYKDAVQMKQSVETVIANSQSEVTIGITVQKL